MDRKIPYTMTATTVYGGTLLVGTVDWLLSCSQAHHFVQPENTLAYAWAGLMAIPLHVMGRIFMKRLNALEQGT